MVANSHEHLREVSSRGSPNLGKAKSVHEGLSQSPTLGGVSFKISTVSDRTSTQSLFRRGGPTLSLFSEGSIGQYL